MVPDWADQSLSDKLPLLRRQGESQVLEFKRQIPEQGHDLKKEIAAFASTNSGIILIGVDDDGSLVGIPGLLDPKTRDKVRTQIENLAGGVIPRITPTVSFALEADQAVLVIEIPRGLQPIYYSNDIAYIRHGTQAQRAQPHEVIERIEAWQKVSKQEGLITEPDSIGSSHEREKIAQALYELAADEFTGGFPQIVTRPRLVLGYVPIAALETPRLVPSKVEKAQLRFPPSMHARIEEGCDATQWWTSSISRHLLGLPNPETKWLMRLKRPGYLQYQMTIGSRVDNDPEIIVDGRALEGAVVFNLERMASICTDLGLPGPAGVTIRMQGMEDVVLTRTRPGGRKFGRYDGPSASVLIQDPGAPMADNFEDTFDIIWQAAGWKDGSPSFSSGSWSGYKNASDYGSL